MHRTPSLSGDIEAFCVQKRTDRDLHVALSLQVATSENAQQIISQELVT